MTCQRNPTSETRRPLDLARLHAYRFLSLLTADPQSARHRRLADHELQVAAVAAAQLIREEASARPASYARGELPAEALNFPRLLSLLNVDPDAVARQHRSIFGLMISRSCPPYETEYSTQTFAVSRSHSLADVAGFYRAFGLRTSSDLAERCDHISLELELMAWLIAKEQYALELRDEPHALVCREAQVRFVREHLAWWVPAFAHALRRQADGIASAEELEAPPSTFYGAVAAALAAFIAAERAILGIAPCDEPALVDPAPYEDSAAGVEAHGESAAAHT